MLRARQFTVDSRRVVHETIDGETILIDLQTGTYFSLRGSGSQIWALLIAGRSEAEVAAEMQRRYPAAAVDAGAGTAELIAQLVAAGLLDDGTTDPAASVQASQREAVADVLVPDGPYEHPVLERYTDMQYFLLLDPIHEVQEGGWPHAATPPAGPTETG